MGLEHSMKYEVSKSELDNDIHHPNPLQLLSYKRTATNFLSAMLSKAADWCNHRYVHGIGLETAHAILTSHFHLHLPGTFGANKMASICVVSSNCLNDPRQCFEGNVSFNKLIVQKTHPTSFVLVTVTKNRNFLTAKILFKIALAEPGLLHKDFY